MEQSSVCTAPSVSVSTGRHRLLLIDDNVTERDLYEMALEPEFNVITATRGVVGLALAAVERPDAIVLDVMMPEMDGWETCSRIKGQPATADIPVILLTGTHEHDLSRQATAVGASAILIKPCSLERLRQTILAALDRSRES